MIQRSKVMSKPGHYYFSDFLAHKANIKFPVKNQCFRSSEQSFPFDSKCFLANIGQNESEFPVEIRISWQKFCQSAVFYSTLSMGNIRIILKLSPIGNWISPCLSPKNLYK